MTAVEVRVRYHAHDVWVHPILLGWTANLTRHGTQVEIRLPAGPEEFAREHSQQVEEPDPSVVGAATLNEPDWDSSAVAIRLFNVTVRLDAGLPVDRPDNPFDGEYGELADAAYERGQQLCYQVAQDFLRWLRASSRQPWLGLSVAPPQQYGPGGLYYAETGQGIFGIGPEQSLTFRSSRLRLEREVLDSLVAKLAAQEAVPVAEALLADAWNLNQDLEVRDYERAVLLAAIACEVRSQEFLREHVPADRRLLLEVALRRTSTLSVLLDEVSDAALGVSLKVADRALYDRIMRALLTHPWAVRPGS